MTYSCYSVLLTGDLLNAIVCPFTNVMGYWFYAVMMLIALAGIYFKSQNVTLVALMGIMSGTTMAMLFPPETHQFAYVMVAIAMAGILYKVFKG